MQRKCAQVVGAAKQLPRELSCLLTALGSRNKAEANGHSAVDKLVEYA
jgi:hypothetical protein